MRHVHGVAVLLETAAQDGRELHFVVDQQYAHSFIRASCWLHAVLAICRAMLKHAPESTEGTGARQSTRSELRTEVVWFPAAMLLLGFQVVVLMHGFGVPLPFELHAVYLA